MLRPEEQYDDENQVEELEFYHDEEEQRSKAATAPAWIISILVHALLISSLLYMLMPCEDKPREERIITQTIPLEEIKEDDKKVDVVKILQMSC